MPTNNSFGDIHEVDPRQPDEDARPSGVDNYIQQIKETADKLARDGASRGDIKLLATALRELYAAENQSDAFIDYGDKFRFSMNEGDYQAPDQKRE